MFSVEISMIVGIVTALICWTVAAIIAQSDKMCKIIYDRYDDTDVFFIILVIIIPGCSVFWFISLPVLIIITIAKFVTNKIAKTIDKLFNDYTIERNE